MLVRHCAYAAERQSLLAHQPAQSKRTRLYIGRAVVAAAARQTHRLGRDLPYGTRRHVRKNLIPVNRDSAAGRHRRRKASRNYRLACTNIFGRRCSAPCAVTADARIYQASDIAIARAGKTEICRRERSSRSAVVLLGNGAHQAHRDGARLRQQQAILSIS